MVEDTTHTGPTGAAGRTTDPTVDRQLLAAIADGDEGALAILLTRYRRDMVAVARRVAPTVEIADEAVADAHLAVWQHAGRYEPRGSVRAWVLGIVRNKARQLTRSHVRRLHHESALELQRDPAEVVADPAVVMLGSPRLSGLAAAFDRLSPVLRETLALLFDQHLSYAEIAVILDVPLGTVKRRISAARAALSAGLET